ncbi:MAG TPA: hypothetical protein VND96_04940 [Candidatus Micrarchaeaceae archaeon]|nr:hypothetical protein [Candidatus Micrarchaeaceae archaeon]
MATTFELMRGGGRVTNLALLSLLAVAFASGWVAFELGGQPARATLVIHAAAGVAIVLLAPWKSLVARRGLRRLRWPSLVLALGVVISLGFGFVHSFGRPDIGYLTAIDFHVGAAICVLPFVIWHVLARPVKLRRADLSRRNFLKGEPSWAYRSSGWRGWRRRGARPPGRTKPHTPSRPNGCSTARRRSTPARGASRSAVVGGAMTT